MCYVKVQNWDYMRICLAPVHDNGTHKDILNLKADDLLAGPLRVLNVGFVFQ